MLAGRDRELERLAEVLADGGAVVVSGPAGIGKSTLCRAVLDRRGTWQESGALATLRWSPLLVFRRLLGDAVRDDPQLVAAQVVRSDPGAVLLDDLQWADDRSLDVVGHLVGRVPVLATVRALDPGSTAALAALELVGFTSVELPPLSPEASEALVDHVRPGLGPEERERILVQGGGNPLLLSELAGPGEATPTLVRALQARLEDLPEPARDAMRRLSVLGRPARSELLGPGADRLVDAGLAARRGEAIEIHHALLAEAVVEDLGPGADRIRRELAALVAPAEGAFLLARVGARAEARELALEAAATVASRRVAAELLALAVECADPGDLDAATRVAAGRAFSRLGDGARALALCLPDGMEELPREQRGSLFGAAAEGAWTSGQTTRFGELVEAAVDDLDGTGSDIEVLVLAGSTLVDTRLRLDGSGSIERARRAVDLADELGVHQGFARARLASVLLTAGEPGWSELFHEVIADAADAGDDELRFMAAESLVLGEWIAGDVDRALVASGALLDEPSPRGYEASWLAVAAYAGPIGLLAALDREELIARWSPVLEAEPMFRDRLQLLASVAIALADLGRYREAGTLLSTAETTNVGPQLASVRCWAEAEIAWLGGRPAVAVEAAVRADHLGVGDYPPAVMARLIGGHAHVELGLAPEAPEPDAMSLAWAAAPHEWRGIVARARHEHVEAVGHLDRAADAWQRHDRRSEVRCRWAAADAAAAGGLPEAVERLVAAERLATLRQIGDLAARARRSLRASGVSRRSAREPGVAGLTAREVAVLRLVGDGHSSTRIAEELRISPSTVDSLVRSAKRRLGAPNRRTAAALVAQQANGPVKPGRLPEPRS